MIMENFENEIWKDIPEYEGRYQASNLGRIKSLNYNRSGKSGILKAGGNIYCVVTLFKNGNRKGFLVHRLVWKTFNGAIPDGMEVNHIDENPRNNSLLNLNLLFPHQNSNWKHHNFNLSKSLKEKNKNGKLSKSVLQFNFNNELINEYPSTHQVERELGYFATIIAKCCRGKLKQAYGYIWKYKKDCQN